MVLDACAKYSSQKTSTIMEMITSLSSTAKTNMGQVVNNTVKTGHSKLALADYGTSADALDKGLKDLLVFFFSTWSGTHLLHET